LEPETLAEKIEEAIISAASKWVKNVTTVQDEIYDSVVLKLKDLELDSDGFIKQNSANRKILREAQGQFDAIVSDSKYKSNLLGYLKVIPKLDDLNESYFKAVSEAFTPNKIYINQLRAQTLETVNGLILQDGFVAQVKIPLNGILNQNVNTGGSFSGMLDQLRIFIKGNEKVEGKLISYSNNIIKDALFQYARSFQQSVVSDLKLKWYLYAGGLIDRSRPFCIERAGKYFTEEEIKSWVPLEWSGKNKLTTQSSIFILVGGHACSHQLIAVSELIVPAEDIARAKELGYV
jgi:hypothetical protein